MPKDAYSGYVHALPVDVQQGTIKLRTELPVTVIDNTDQVLKRFGGHTVIHWQELVDTALRTHANFPDLFSIGWDLTVTPDGVKLIEGNINWAVSIHQLDGPALMPEFLSYIRISVKITQKDDQI